MSTPQLRPLVLPPTLDGLPAPCDLFDAHGTLLLRAGHPLATALLNASASRRVYCQAQRVPHFARQAPLRTLRDVGEALALIETLLDSGSGPRAEELLDLAAQCHAAWRFDPDACIGYARLARPPAAAAGHVLLAALFVAEIGHAHGLPAQRVEHLIGAALTMNLGSLALHDTMHASRAAPDEEQQLALADHPQRAARLLVASGELPAEWIAAVAQHHENVDGSGYPLGLERNAITLGARMLRVADVLAARLRGRQWRHPRYWNIAHATQREQLIRHIFEDDLERLDKHIVRLLIERLGPFPPGSMVRLSNGELALINRRDAGAGLRPQRALSLTDARGRILGEPRPRPLGARDHHIQGYAHDLQPHHLPDYDWPRLWGYSEHGGRVH